jgi:Mn2+/Fe2+ NRAMP family transporter
MSLGRKIRSIALFEQLGPGLVAGAADDDPSGIATYSQTGARFGYGLLWTMLLTYPLMTAIQLISGEIGRVTGCGLARNMGAVIAKPAVTALVALLFIVNTINIGADLAAMGAASQLLAGGGAHWFTAGFAVLSLLLQMFIPYKRYVRILKWLTLVLFAYVAVLLVVKLDWAAAGRGLVWPEPAVFRSKEALTTVVAIFGRSAPISSSGRRPRRSRKSITRTAPARSRPRPSRPSASCGASSSTPSSGWRSPT